MTEYGGGSFYIKYTTSEWMSAAAPGEFLKESLCS